MIRDHESSCELLPNPALFQVMYEGLCGEPMLKPDALHHSPDHVLTEAKNRDTGERIADLVVTADVLLGGKWSIQEPPPKCDYFLVCDVCDQCVSI